MLALKTEFALIFSRAANSNFAAQFIVILGHGHRCQEAAISG